jgi:hypothetical protein
MALTSVVYGTAPYDRPFRLPQLSGGFYGDHQINVGPGQAADGANTYSFGGAWFEISSIATPTAAQFAALQANGPSGPFAWVAIGVGTSIPTPTLGGVFSDAGGPGIFVFAQAVASSSTTIGDIPLCVLGVDTVGRIIQMIDQRTFSQPGNKPDWWP